MSHTPEEHWSRELVRLRAARADGEPDAMAEFRAAAAERFVKLGFPTRRQEEWRYTPLTALLRFPVRGTDLVAFPAPPGAAVPGRLCHAPAARLSFVNGRLAAADVCDGRVEVGTLVRAVAREPDLLERTLAGEEAFADDPFVALNGAAFGEGAYVRIPAGVSLTAPVEVSGLSDPGGEPHVAHPRLLILAEPRSSATVVEAHRGQGTGAYLTNTFTHVELASGARLEHVHLQDEGAKALHLGRFSCRQQRDSVLVSHVVALGATLARQDLRVALQGEGAECTLRGLYAGCGSQHLEHHTAIDHRSPHTTSHELYKGILAGAARGVFHGRIVVLPAAQKIDAHQHNANLLLSPRAEVDTKPQLEIHADDVRCSHGSTIGHLDEDALFYLRARGLSGSQARRILTRAFAAEITNRLPVTELREPLEGHLETALGERAS